MKTLLGVLFLLLPLSTQAEDPTFFRTVAPIQAICTMGGPGDIIEELLEKYNEKPVHALMVTPTIQMYIAQNCNNPSSTLFYTIVR